jgi:hypothetical protein
MEVAYIQIWEEYNINTDPILIGASIHITEDNCSSYIEANTLKIRKNKKIPDKYTYHLGRYSKCMITKTLHEQLKPNGYIFIKDHQLHNLVMFNKLIEIL